MRIGLFGGSFNPIHFGHLRAAEEAREALALDLVYFVPAASPPHKTTGNLAPPEHRLEMVWIATKGNRHFMVSEFELKKAGRSYTIDTVRHFLATLRQPLTLFLLMGFDTFADLGTWHRVDELVTLCDIAIHPRPGSPAAEQVPVAPLTRFGYVKNDGGYVHPSGRVLLVLKSVGLPISGTDIRQRLEQGRSVRYLLPNEVRDYVERHGLY